MITKIGLDLGYASITVSDPSSGMVREPAIVLVEKTTNRILAFGERAMEADPGQNGILVRPFKNGMLYSSELTSAIVKNALSSLGEEADIRCIVGLPSDFLPKQQKELYAMIRNAGATEVYGVKRAYAAMLGAGAAPTESLISVNVGASKTDIAVIHEGKVLFSSVADIGGEAFDEAVQEYIYEQGDVRVSLSVAKAIKEKLGAVWPGKSNDSIDIEGTLSLTGNRINMNISTEDVLGVFEKPLSLFLMAVANQVKQIPIPQVPAIFKKGILLSGGGALLFGLDKMLEKVLDVPVMCASDPINCVSVGLSRVHSCLPVSLKLGSRDITDKIAKFYEQKKQKTMP